MPRPKIRDVNVLKSRERLFALPVHRALESAHRSSNGRLNSGFLKGAKVTDVFHDNGRTLNWKPTAPWDL